MPKRTLTQSITLVRNGKRVTLEPGRVHELSAEEIADVLKVSPGALSTTATVELQEDAVVEKTPAEIKAAKDAAKAAAKAATGPTTGNNSTETL